MKKWQALIAADADNQRSRERRVLDWNETAPHPKEMAAITCDRRKSLIGHTCSMVLVKDDEISGLLRRGAISPSVIFNLYIKFRGY